ncbi:MAG TPA: carboxypeptidase-like regulatory domain-containing protein, partial [Thermoanaerobaculia bacterium]|nr:carboxypeptidase-like regulatory domain-containing protein [Thermoanaerobaculia bacterium]
MDCLVCGPRQTFAIALLCLLCAVPSGICAQMHINDQPSGTVHVTIRSGPADPVPVHGAYVALVGMDRPMYRPTMETVADGEVKWSAVPPGPYLLVVDAANFQPVVRHISVTSYSPAQASINLSPDIEVSGRVIDGAGKPIAGATIANARIVPPPNLSGMSDMSRRHALSYLITQTDESGSWKGRALPTNEMSFLVEAAGYAPAWVKREPGSAELPAVTLKPGSSLKIVTDRAAPDLILQLRSTAIETPIPPQIQHHIWAREAATKVVEWPSLPAGEYDVVAFWPDPARYTDALTTLQHIRLSEGRGETITLKLPQDPPRNSNSIRVIVPRLDKHDLHAFARGPKGGMVPVRVSSETVAGGIVLYADADGPPEDVFFTTPSSVVVTPGADPSSGFMDQAVMQGVRPASSDAVVNGVVFAKAEGQLRLTVPEDTVLPSTGIAQFHDCVRNQGFVLPVDVPKNGQVSEPLLVGCHGLTLSFGGFSPLMMALHARGGERVALGTFKLRTAATATVHVIQEPSGNDVAGAVVTAFVDRGSAGHQSVSRRVALQNGRAVLEGLPVGEEVTFRAQNEATNLSGKLTRVLRPGERATIELPIPQPASLTVIPRLAPQFDVQFKDQNAKPQIVGVIADPEQGERSDHRSMELDPSATEQRAQFRTLIPGNW